MHRDVRRAAAGIAVAFYGCSVYDPSILTGPEDGGSSGSTSAGFGGAGGAEGGTSSGRGADGGTSGDTNGGTAAGGSGASGGKATGGGGSGATSGSGGDGATSGSSGDAGDTGSGGTSDGGEAGEGGGAGDGGSSGTAGSSGSSGNGGGGVGGSAGTAGGGASGGGAGGSAGTAGGGTGGSAGSGLEPCPTGCARLSLNAFTDTSQKAHYAISFPSPTNLNNATITYRIFKQAGESLQFRAYIQNGASSFQFSFLGAGVSLSGAPAWRDLTFNVNDSTSVDRGTIKRIGIELNGSGGQPWAATVVYVDSIIVTPAAGMSPWQFTMADSILTTPTNTDPTTEILWLNNNSGDTSAALNAMLSHYIGN